MPGKTKLQASNLTRHLQTVFLQASLSHFVLSHFFNKTA